ncbi:MAG TPA: hemerythrin domain-containing protein [Candidatus Binatia bacterium]
MLERIAQYFGGGEPDAVALLEQDHKKVKALFKEFEDAEDGRTKKRIVTTTIRELIVHATVEEEIFYPAIRGAVEEDKVDEAEEEHHVMELLIGELQKMKPSDERYDAKFTVLAESVKHHMEEEESEVFPEAKDKIDGRALGATMAERKAELEQRNGNRASPRKPKAARRRQSVEKAARV